MLRQVERDYQTCDWCGAMTRGRTQIEEPTVLRCGACHYPLSEGSYRVEAPRQVVKIEIQDPAPPRMETCTACGTSINLNGFGWLVNGVGQLICGHKCFEDLWRRAERIAKGEATWTDL